MAFRLYGNSQSRKVSTASHNHTKSKNPSQTDWSSTFKSGTTPDSLPPPVFYEEPPSIPKLGKREQT